MTERRTRHKLTALVTEDVWLHIRGLAQEQGAALARVVEEALREYTIARPLGANSDLIARVPKRSGRPSRIDADADAARRARLQKRCGRPMRIGGPDDAGSAGAG